MKEITLRDLKERINKLPEEEQNKTIEELYALQYTNSLGKIFKGTDFSILASWDYDD